MGFGTWEDEDDGDGHNGHNDDDYNEMKMESLKVKEETSVQRDALGFGTWEGRPLVGWRPGDTVDDQCKL